LSLNSPRPSEAGTMHNLSRIRGLIRAGEKIVPSREAPQPESPSHIGFRLKFLRQQAGLSMASLADASKVSKSNISKIENGLISPTFEVMERLSRGLGVPTSHLLSDGTFGNVGISLARAGRGRRMSDHHYDFEFLFTDLGNRRMVPFVTTVTPKGLSPKTPASHEGEEFFYVLSGAVTFAGGDEGPIDLDVGDALYFNSAHKHLVLNRTAEESRLLWVWLE